MLKDYLDTFKYYFADYKWVVSTPCPKCSTKRVMEGGPWKGDMWTMTGGTTWHREEKPKNSSPCSECLSTGYIPKELYSNSLKLLEQAFIYSCYSDCSSEKTGLVVSQDEDIIKSVYDIYLERIHSRSKNTGNSILYKQDSQGTPFYSYNNNMSGKEYNKERYILGQLGGFPANPIKSTPHEHSLESEVESTNIISAIDKLVGEKDSHELFRNQPSTVTVALWPGIRHPDDLIKLIRLGCTSIIMPDWSYLENTVPESTVNNIKNLIETFGVHIEMPFLVDK